jgi:hypothetical protein
MSATATRTEVPRGAVSDFSPDYADCFRIASVADTTAADWARASLRGADGPFGRVVWQGLLGFRLAPGTPGTLVGWPISHDTPERFVLESDGPLMAGRMVFELADGDVWWTTSLHFHRALARVIWAGAGPGHRRLAPRCLDQAHRRLSGAQVTRSSGSSA